MAQVHYVIMGDYDEEVVYAYLSANKGKINKLARDFEQTEDEDGGTRNYIWEQGSAKYKDSFMFVMNNGEMYCEAVTEEEFRNKAESMEYAAFFTGLKDLEINIPIENAGFDEDLEFSEADYYGDEPKLVWAYYEYVVGESKQTKAMKYIPTFESFIGSQKVNERYATFADVFDEYGWSDAYEEKYWDMVKALEAGGLYDLVWIGEGMPPFLEGKKSIEAFNMEGLERGTDGIELDPHGDCEFELYKVKGMLIGMFYGEAHLNGTICNVKDAKKWEKYFKKNGAEEYLY